MLLLFPLVLSLQLYFSGAAGETFHVGVLCDLDQRIGDHCSTLVSQSTTLNKCVFQCSQDTVCVGASLDRNRNCYHHYSTCPTLAGCSKRETDHTYRSKNCAHGGVWNPQTAACSCANSWVGEHCTELPSHCVHLSNHGYSSRRSYLNLDVGQADPIQIVPVFCRISPTSSYTNVQVFRHRKGEINFNRTWEEYKRGFYIDDDNFWIGLENWHALSTSGFTWLIMAVSIGQVYRAYDNFFVRSESNGFSFSFDRTSTSRRQSSPYDNLFGDCFTSLKEKPFCTKDRDHCGTEKENCSAKLGSGWWRDAEDCTASACNFLGKLPQDWDDIPEIQRLRVSGCDPEVLKNSSSPVYINMYITDN